MDIWSINFLQVSIASYSPFVYIRLPLVESLYCNICMSLVFTGEESSEMKCNALLPGGAASQSAEFSTTERKYLNLIFRWPCIIMYHNNVTNLKSYTFTFTITITLLCRNPLHVSGVKRPSSGGTTLAVFWWELRALLAASSHEFVLGIKKPKIFWSVKN
jgi:hypothetical protein